ncbi:MAG: PLP-dependent aminotransferase family protein [Desulfomonile tiedjei]|uniref:PLP-dependent aminotransferase family protein n=1 Tax=Desulfomonile tiedjei TaxID=2358 RepID=A0A9D6V1Q9_9BACT|nr:PLP-dependent aminotransferase family protein [Desulfomonile tiedjei]
MDRLESNPGVESEKINLYEQVAERMAHLITEGTFRPGERISSVRGLSRQLGVSLSTVMAAYGLLENLGLIEARPQSGYYVRARLKSPSVPMKREIPSHAAVPKTLSVSDICVMLLGSLSNRDLVPLGGALPSPELLPVDRLTRTLSAVTRRFKNQSVSYDVLPGCKTLRTQIARRAMTAGCLLTPDHIVTTHGCFEAVNLSLRVVCNPGDTVAIESPIFYGFLQMIQTLGLQAIEIPSHPTEGISIPALGYAIEHHKISACLVISNFSNPLGSCMSDESKKALVELLSAQDIPLIEDDIYGDICFQHDRPIVAKAFDKKGLVLLCSSFSKTVAPGYRVGWIAAGRFQEQIERLKVLSNGATATPNQLAVAEFLATGGYDHHLRRIRRVYANQTAAMARAVEDHFPKGTSVTRPTGGFVLWVECPNYVNALKLYEMSLEAGISIAPGPVFSIKGKYQNCLRLNAGFWSPRIENAVAIVGKLAAAMKP